MKEYFSHDYNARDDEKMPKLLSELGYEGYGIYWAVVEMLYKNDGYMQLDCKSIAFALHCDSNCLTKVINDFDLFVNDDGRFYSESVLKRLGIRRTISEKRSNAAKIKWNAIAEQKDNKSNAIKEKKKKEKEIKVKESKEKDIIDIIFSKCVEFYFEFYESKVGFKPPFEGREGKSVKGILKHIQDSMMDKKINVTEDSLFNGFQAIFQKLPKFYLEKLDINMIHNNYGKIIAEIKSGKSTGNTAQGFSNVLAERQREREEAASKD